MNAFSIGHSCHVNQECDEATYSEINCPTIAVITNSNPKTSLQPPPPPAATPPAATPRKRKRGEEKKWYVPAKNITLSELRDKVEIIGALYK